MSVETKENDMKRWMNRIGAFMVIGVLLMAASAQADEPKQASKLPTGAIEKAIGKAGEMKDEVYKISLPRKDLSVTVKGVKIKPGLALGSWIAFEAAANE